MNKALKDRVLQLLENHDQLCREIADPTLPERYRKSARQVLVMVDATINMLMARLELDDARRQAAARAAVAAQRTMPKRGPLRDLIGTAALVWMGSEALGHWSRNR